MSPADVMVRLNSLNIKYERKFNDKTFILKNKNYNDNNMIILFITEAGFKIMLYDESVLREENFKNIKNLYSKYNHLTKISKYYKKENYVRTKEN